jgi:hypothetical protein
MKSVTFEELRVKVKDAPKLIVEDMIQMSTVNVLIGDSGLGKSPLLMQMGICVALGIPFLGLETRKVRVLYIDYENSLLELRDTIDNLTTFLGRPAGEDFRVLHFPATKADVLKEIKEFKPGLVIIDALRGYDPRAEKDNESMAICLKGLHDMAIVEQCAFEILHHIRKKDTKDPPPRLLAASIMDWLQQASGARALINQTAARFAIEDYTVGDASLVMRGHFKLKGEVGPWKLKRVFGEQEDPLGYERMIGLDMLIPIDQARYESLPAIFTWTEAEIILGMKAGKTLKRFLTVCIAAGLLRKTGIRKETRYHKVP